MKCIKCETEMGDDVKFCPKCGAAAESASASAEPKKGKGLSGNVVVGLVKKHWKIILGVIVVVLIIVNLNGTSLDEEKVEGTIIELLNDRMLSADDFAGVRATEVVSLDLEKSDKKWTGTAVVLFKGNNNSCTQKVEVEVMQTKKNDEHLVEIKFPDPIAATIQLQQL